MTKKSLSLQEPEILGEKNTWTNIISSTSKVFITYLNNILKFRSFISQIWMKCTVFIKWYQLRMCKQLTTSVVLQDQMSKERKNSHCVSKSLLEPDTVGISIQIHIWTWFIAVFSVLIELGNIFFVQVSWQIK